MRAARRPWPEGVNKLFSKLGLEVTSPGYQAITGGAKLAIIVGYLLLIRRMPEVRRVFQYHGAEHKTITTYEAGEDLVVACCHRPKTTAHARCGTTFLVMVGARLGRRLQHRRGLLPACASRRAYRPVQRELLRGEAPVPSPWSRPPPTSSSASSPATAPPTAAARAASGRASWCRRSPPPSPTTPSSRSRWDRSAPRLWRENVLEAPAPVDRTLYSGYGELIADPGYARA